LLPKRDLATERKNLRKYGELVWVHNYIAAGKLEPRAIKARIINYTNTYNVYWTIDAHGKRRLSKAPRPAQSEENEVEGYLPVGESNIPENTFLSENNSKDPTVNKVPATNRKTPIHCSRNTPRHQCSSQFDRKTSEGTKYTELGDGAKGIGVLVLNEVRRSMFEQAQRSRDRDSSGRFVVRRTGKRNNRGNTQNGRPNDTRQDTTSLSISEAEYIAAAEGSKDASWLR
jgi:hypothetical protein